MSKTRGREGHLERARLLELFREHQQRIQALLDEAEAALNSTDASRSRALALIRWQLIRCLRGYQLFKHNELFNPLCRGSDTGKARAASLMKTQCVATSEAYDLHAKAWSVRGIDSAWPQYKNETQAMIAQIHQHLARERVDSEILLSGAISPRPLAARES